MTGEEPGGVRLASSTAVRLVADREIRTRLRSRAYRITTGVLVVLVVGFALVMKVVAASDSPAEVGFVPAAGSLAATTVAAARGSGQHVDMVPVDSAAAGRAMVSAGDLDALVLGIRGTRLDVVVEKKLGDGLRAVLTGAAERTALDRQISDLGGDPARVSAQVAGASVAVSSLHPPQKFDPQRLAVGSIAGILIYLALVATGQSVAQGVVEEKSSRVVELLLSTIRPWELMAGKVVGIGLVGLLQVALVGAAGLAAGRATGSLTLSVSATAGVLGWLVLWFVLGFTLFALVFAALGALVSRQEDVGGVVAPAMMFLVLGYVVGISVLPAAPDNTAVALMSLLPVFSPTLMPMRLAMGAVPLWQVLVSLLLALAMIPALVAVAGRMYRNGVVRTGTRVRLREAVRRG